MKTYPIGNVTLYVAGIQYGNGCAIIPRCPLNGFNNSEHHPWIITSFLSSPSPGIIAVVFILDKPWLLIQRFDTDINDPYGNVYIWFVFKSNPSRK